MCFLREIKVTVARRVIQVCLNNFIIGCELPKKKRNVFFNVNLDIFENRVTYASYICQGRGTLRNFYGAPFFVVFALKRLNKNNSVATTPIHLKPR